MEAQLAVGFLLQRRGGKRRRRGAFEWLLVHRVDAEASALELRGQRRSCLRIQHADVVVFQLAGIGIEVGTPSELRALEGLQSTVKLIAGTGCELGGKVPVFGGAESHPGALALYEHADRHALDASGGEARSDLAPQHRRHQVAVEAVDDAARFLRFNKVVIDLTSLLERRLYGTARDLVEHHAAHRDLRLEDLDQVPADRLALAVLIGSEQQLVGLLEGALELGNGRLLRRLDDVKWLERLVDLDAEARPGLSLVPLGDLRGVGGQVADMADTRLDDELRAEKLRQGLRLGR